MIRFLIRKWLGIEELQNQQKEIAKDVKMVRSRPATMQDRMRRLEQRSYEQAVAGGSPFAKTVPPGVRAPQ